MHKDSTRVMSNEDISMQMQHSRLRAWSETERVWLVKIYEEEIKQHKKRVFARISKLFKEHFKYERSEDQLRHQMWRCKNNCLPSQRKQWFTPYQNERLLSLREEHGTDKAKMIRIFKDEFPDVTLTPNTLYTRLSYLLKRKKSSSHKQLDRSQQPMHQSLPHPSTADQSTPDQSILDQWPLSETADSHTGIEDAGNDAGADLFDQLLGTT
jgi:hypothetical protein